ncbi:MAG TPA: zinc ribbon domain-containing protein [Ktedonobacteraceae bacterium]|nr:zinc ribbon domain-containing protein [Ktedonobacteraceae bacterium]
MGIGFTLIPHQRSVANVSLLTGLNSHEGQRTCPVCGHRRKSSPRGRVFGCTNTTCKWQGHRDGVGAANIRAKYRGECGGRHVVGTMALPTGCGYVPQLRVSL